MSEPDLSLAILREIRDEIRGTNTRLDATKLELKAEISAVRTELKIELNAVRTELVVVGETLKDLAAQQLMLTRYVKNVVDRHEQSIEELRDRVARLEASR